MAQGGRLDKALAPCDDLRMNRNTIIHRLIRQCHAPRYLALDLYLHATCGEVIADDEIEAIVENIHAQFGIGSRRARRWERGIRADAAQWNADMLEE